MPNVILSEDIEKRLEYISKFENVKKNDIIIKALKKYFEEYEKNIPYKLGENLFGKYGSNTGDLSENYKSKLKRKLYDKHSH